MPTIGGDAAYWQGFLSAILNPKLVVFFATFLPQFVQTRQPILPQMLLLGALFDIMVVIWLMGYGLFVTRMRAVFQCARDPPTDGAADRSGADRPRRTPRHREVLTSHSFRHSSGHVGGTS